MSTLTAKLLTTKNNEAMTLPAIVTARHPNLLDNAPTTGPDITVSHDDMRSSFTTLLKISRGITMPVIPLRDVAESAKQLRESRSLAQQVAVSSKSGARQC